MLSRVFYLLSQDEAFRERIVYADEGSENTYLGS